MAYPPSTANHRGRDLFLTPDDPQWVLGKMAYGLLDIRLAAGEDVDIFVLRDCTGEWEHLGTTKTTSKGEHATVEGVEDTGGRVFFQIPDEKKLGIGRHRIRMVVAGDGSGADQYIEVVPRGTPIFVSDVDGTLTERTSGDLGLACDEESEEAMLVKAGVIGISLPQPALHAGASELYSKLVGSGYRVLYLTARPEWLEPETHKFLHASIRGDGRGDLPEGIVHTTLSDYGTFSIPAATFKEGELQAMRDKGLPVILGFANQQSDIDAYTKSQLSYAFYYDNPDTIFRTCAVPGVKSLPLPPASMPADGLGHSSFRYGTYTSLVPLFSQVIESCRSSSSP